jgi:hypothetical protein
MPCRGRTVTPEGLKDVFKDFNLAGSDLVERLRTFRRHGVYVLGSFIFALPIDRQETFAATARAAQQAEIAFAQFVTLTPFPGTVDFMRWEKHMEASPVEITGVPITRRWLIPLRRNTQSVWDTFYGLKSIWVRSRFIKSLRARLAFVLISKSIAKCMPIPASRRTVLEYRDPRAGRVGLQGHVSASLLAGRCHTCGSPSSERLYRDKLPFAWMERVSSAVSRERSQ